jgi:carbon monoxide dehydrogenase subunit G
MELSNEFEVPVPVEQAWLILTDLERIAPCLPGAQLQEVEGDVYRGIVKIKVGPITAQYKGQAVMVDKDDAAHVAVLEATGRDTRGAGNASAAIKAELTDRGDVTHVSVMTDLTVTGKVAQFGRGVLADVSAKLLDQFVVNLEATVLAEELVEEAAEDVMIAAVTDDAELAGAALDDAAARLDVADAVESLVDHTPIGEGGARDERVASAGSTDAVRSAVRRIDSPEVAPVDLLDTAGSPLVMRAAPLVGMVVVVFVLHGLRGRRRRRRAG